MSCLPVDIRTSCNTTTFKKKLKTFLFRKAFYLPSPCTGSLDYHSFIHLLYIICSGLVNSCRKPLSSVIITIIIIIINCVLLLLTALHCVAAGLSGNANALVLINVVALPRARLVLGCVVFNQSHPGLLSLAIPLWVGTMRTGGGLGHR